MSQYYNISDDEYNDIRNKYAISKVISSLKGIIKLFNNYDENNENKCIFEIIFKLRAYSLRAALILLRNDERELVIDKINEKTPFLVENINNIFNEDFDNIINKDRERHKILSLNI